MRWSKRSHHERLSHIGGFIATTAILESAIDSVQGHYEAWSTKPEGMLLFLTGETRVGKTTAIDEFITDLHAEVQKQHGKKPGCQVPDLGELTATMSLKFTTPDGDRKPLIKILVADQPTFNGLLADILFLLVGKRIPKTTPHTERMHMLKEQLKHQKVRMVIFDDAQHICESTSRDKKYAAADLLKVILKESRVQLICAGLPHTTEMLDANTQADTMTWEKHVVPPFVLDTSSRSDLVRFLRTVSSELPFDRASNLEQPDIALRLHLFSEGCAGRIMLLLHSAVHYALRNGIEKLDADVIAATLKYKFNVADEENVFLMSRDHLDKYHELIRKGRQERIRNAETRRLNGRRKAFGARGK